jgi:hypothetical protein
LSAAVPLSNALIPALILSASAFLPLITGPRFRNDAAASLSWVMIADDAWKASSPRACAAPSVPFVPARRALSFSLTPTSIEAKKSATFLFPNGGRLA